MSTYREPADPVYTKAKPSTNDNCVGGSQGAGNAKFYVPPEEGKTTEILSGDRIEVVDLSDANTDRFKINVLPKIDLSVTLTLVAKISTVVQSFPILLGKIVDEVNLTWSYNKSIAEQTLDSPLGTETDPALRAKDYTSQSITGNTKFDIDGDDGLGYDGSTAAASKSVVFGNMLFTGAAGLSDLFSTGQMTALINGLANSSVETTKQNFLSESGVGEYEYYCYPKSWGEANFKKGIWEGGFIRMKYNGTSFVQDLNGDPEVDYSYTNSEGYSEPYYVYRSSNDNIGDNTEAFIVT